MSEWPKWWRKQTVLWPTVRDLLIYSYYDDLHEIRLAFKLAGECGHPDARWLLSLFPEGPPATRRKMLAVFRQQMLAAYFQPGDPTTLLPLVEDEAWDVTVAVFQGDILAVLQQQDELRAAFYAATIGWSDGFSDMGMVVELARLGYGPAQGWTVLHEDVLGGLFEFDTERVACAEKAAAQNDCYGLYMLASYLMEGWGCKQDREGGLQLMRQAAELGFGEALVAYGFECYGKNDWQRYHWCARAVMKLDTSAVDYVADETVRQLNIFEEQQETSRILFEIGAVLSIEVLEEMQSAELLIRAENFPPLLRAACLYDECCAAAERAIYYWIWFARKWQIGKDVRKLMCKLLWTNRIEWSQPRKESKSRTKE